MKRIALLTLFISLLLSACGGNSVPDPIEITIEMSEYAFSPADIELQVGQEVTLTLINVGLIEHELMIGNVVMKENGQPSSYMEDFFNIGGVTPNVEGSGMLMTHGGGHDEEMDMDMDMDMEEDNHDNEMNMDDSSDEEMDMSTDDHADADEALMVMVPVGDNTTTVTFTVTEAMVGDWELGCFQLSGVHYIAGMVGSLTVLP